MTVIRAARHTNVAGTLICVAGPSGAGKDTLINAARSHFANDARFHFPQRCITRTQTPDEPHTVMDAETFQRLKAAGAFFLAWRAHGLDYAVPADARAALSEGRAVVINISRRVVMEARAAWPRMALIHVTARADVLAARLQARARDGEEAIEERLRRASAIALPAGDWVHELDNSGPLAEARAGFIALLERIAGALPTKRKALDQAKRRTASGIAE